MSLGQVSRYSRSATTRDERIEKLKYFYAYVLKCGDRSFYAGHTDDLDRRVAEHRNGQGSDYTSRRQPVELVWSQTFPSRDEALAAELQIKKWSKRKKQALMDENWSLLSKAARKTF